MGDKDAEEFQRIADFIPFYPALTDPDFSYNIARKKEFQDFALTSEYTPLPGLFRQQVIIERFLAPSTLYNELLIFHQVGAGKTATALAVAESWKTQAREKAACTTKGLSPLLTTPAQCPLIIVRNVDRFTPIFERELNARFPAYGGEATFGKNYEIASHRTAGKKREGSFSNRVIIIDEAHNLQPQSKPGGGTDYKNLWVKLRRAKNSKKLLLTGTPIPDRASQIIPLMNLILPKPIPSDAYGGKFQALYFPEKTFVPQSTLDDSRYDLMRQFQGRVSYFQTIIPGVSQKTQGARNVPIMDAKGRVVVIGTTVPVVCNVMSDFQYTRANHSFLRADKEKKNEAFSQTARREATMTFAAPMPETQTPIEVNKRIRRLIGEMPPTLGALQTYSATFHAIVEDIKKHPSDLFFVYLDYVNGLGGQVNFGYVLERFLGYRNGTKGGGYAILGFQRQLSAGRLRLNKLKKYQKGVDISKTQSRPETPHEAELNARKILATFNSADNIDGKKIHVLIGGQKSGEGITIKNVTRVHLIPYWNFTKSQQAIGRTIRPTSHNALIEARIRREIGAAVDTDDAKFEFGPLVGLSRQFLLACPPGSEKEDAALVGMVPDFKVKEVKEGRLVVAWGGTIEVEVFHHVAVGPPSDGDYRTTQDVHVFHSATEKYVQTAQVLKFLKKISFDCPLTYPANMADGGENYQCIGFPEGKIETNSDVWKYSIPPDQLQYDTYDLFYTNRGEIIAALGGLFAAHSILSFQQILEKTGRRPNPLLGALQAMISRNTPLKNRFGFRCCLREDRDMFFLVAFRDAFRDDQTYDHAIYAALPFVTSQTTLQTLNDFQLLDAKEAADALQTFCEDPRDARAFEKLSLQTRIRLLEEFYENRVDAPPFIAKLLKEIRTIGKVAVHVMLAQVHTEVGSGYKTKLKYTGDMRVLGPAGWRYAFPAEEEKYVKQFG